MKFSHPVVIAATAAMSAVRTTYAQTGAFYELEEVDLGSKTSSTADCTYPCSMGSCKWDNKEPWDSVGNEEEIEQYPFTFVLKKGTPYRITMKRDEDQCAMKLDNWGMLDWKGEKVVDCGYSTSVTDSCGPAGELVREYCRIPETGTYTVYLSMETIGNNGCPRNGFEYSIEISPPPLHGIEQDGSCTAEQRVFVGGKGMISVAQPSLPTSFEIGIEHRSDDSRADPRGKITATQFGSRRRSIVLTAGDLTFYDTQLDWLFTNEDEGCARFQGKGSVLVDGKVAEEDVFFDTIVFNKGDNSNVKDTFQMHIESDNGVDPYWYSVDQPAELDQGDILSLSNVGNNGKPTVAFPLGECEGDCDGDYECEGELVCFMRESKEPVPRCWGEDGMGGTSGTDYCVVRPPKYLQIPLLGECQGDCDTDQECKDDLVCFEREKFAPVPGCDGAGMRGKDYCVSPDASVSSSISVGSSSSDSSSSSSDNTSKYFERVSTFPLCTFMSETCNDDTETVAETVVVTEDASTAVYTDSARGVLGLVDISDLSHPRGITVVNLDGAPASVALRGQYALVCVNTSPSFVKPSGTLIAVDISDPENPVIAMRWDIGGQPDSIAVSPDGRRAAIAVENQRDEDFGDGRPPQIPPGFILVVNTEGDDPAAWYGDVIDVMGLDGALYPEDPEPEYVSINEHNVAVVSLQENNAVVLINLEDPGIIGSFSTGAVTLEDVDLTEDKMILQVETAADLPREVDGLTWIEGNYFVTANEGDMDGGTRGFTVFDTDGNVIFESGMSAEHLITSYGHYPDHRSGNKGVEFNNVVYAEDLELVFVNSERSNVIMVYDVSDPSEPKFHQVLPGCLGPEGASYVKSTQTFVVACEVDSREGKIRASLALYGYGSMSVSYPTIKSVVPDTSTGVPIPWGALSGLSAPADKTNTNTLYTIDDSAFAKSRIFTVDVSRFPYTITGATNVVDSRGVLATFPPTLEFSAADLAAMINDDGTVNLDQEGIAAVEDGFWIAHEGRGNYGDDSTGRPVESLNFMIKVDADGVIEDVVTLPEDVNTKQIRFGFEGVTVEGDYVVAAIQRAWDGEDNPRIGFYNTVDKTWKFVFYPTDPPESQKASWVGIGDITSLGDGDFLVLERDNQGGPDAAIKRIYKISLGHLDDIGEEVETVEKHLIRDILDDVSTSIGGLALEKVEGLACLDGDVFIQNDNDATDFSSGETWLINLGKILEG